MSTFFIALQCCQCSTMQVKQKKKSSNKWCCVVCNQKQSVRQVFAQGPMAKDVRKYVQTFNMSRQLAEHRGLAPPEPEVEIKDDFSTNQKKKRTDWNEYVDHEIEAEIKDDSVDVFEPRIVTELPKALFKKPKLKNCVVADFDSEDGDKPLRPLFGKRRANNRTKSPDKEPSFSRKDGGKPLGPVFGKRKANNRTESPDKEPGISRKDALKWSDCKRKAVHNLGCKGPLKPQQAPLATGASKWNQYISQKEEEEDGYANMAAYGAGSLRKKGISKWSSFITEEDDELLLESVTEFKGQWNNNAAFKTTINEQKVEDDIHPDFL